MGYLTASSAFLATQRKNRHLSVQLPGDLERVISSCRKPKSLSRSLSSYTVYISRFIEDTRQRNWGTMWRRMPTWFPNIRLTMLPITPEQKQQVLNHGWLREAAFKTEPRVNKLEIKAFLEAVYGMEVERVSTINYQGKKKMMVSQKGRAYFKRLSDWKKAYVIFKNPPEKLRAAWEESKQQQQRQKQKQWEQQQQRRQLRQQQMGSLLPPAAEEAVAAAGRSKMPQKD